MIEHMITLFAQSKAAWILLVTTGLIGGLFALYYISFAVYLIVASLYTGVRLIPESFRVWRGELADEKDIGWNSAQLGVTMPDGGEPVDEDESEEEEEA